MPVLTALLWVLRVILIVLGILLVLILCLLCVRTGIEAVGVTGKCTVDFRFGLLRIPIYPMLKKEKKKKEPKTSSTAPKQHKEKQKRFEFSEVDIGETVDLVITLLSELTDRLQIRRLRARILVGTDDAAKTGILLGAISAAIGIFIPFLENTFNVRNYRISADADFEATQTEWAFQLLAVVRPILILLVVLRHGGAIWKLYQKLKVKKEATKV